MNILDLKENECISVETEQEAIELCKKFDELGLKWTTGESYLGNSRWWFYANKIAYVPHSGTYSLADNLELLGYTVYPAKLFITPVDYYSKRLIEFYQAFNSPVAETPQIPNKERALLRVALLQEELDELKEAIENDDLVECADAIIDIMVINEGNVVEWGLQYVKQQMYDEVMNSNMSKLDENGQPIINGENGVFDSSRPLGKILKSKLFKEPDLKQFL